MCALGPLLNAKQTDWVYDYGDYLVFDTEFFFLFLLPPIIFESGYALDAEPFFRNLGKILYFAFAGTIIGAGVFGLGMYALGQIGLSHPFSFVNAMMFGSIISATDPVSVLAIFNDLKVDRDLFALVFGESVMNDAVAMVLYRSMYTFEAEFTFGGCMAAVWTFVVVFLGSTAIGLFIALASALFFKHFKLSDEGIHMAHPSGGLFGPDETKDATPRNHHASAESAVHGAVLEASVVMLFPWIAYMLAETLQLVGIVSILFCGIVMGHYTRRNLSEGGRALTMGVFGLMAQLSETFVFIYMGASVFLAQSEYYNTAVLVVVMCLVSRAFAIYPGVKLINWRASRKSKDGGNGNAAGGGWAGEVPENHAHMLWFSGLRGAMAFALALEAAAKRGDDGRAMLTGTLGAVLFTVLGTGGFIVAALHYLNIQCGAGGGGNGGNFNYESIVQIIDSAVATDSNGGRNESSGSVGDGDAKVLVSSDLSEGDTRERTKAGRARGNMGFTGGSGGSGTDGGSGGAEKVGGMQRFKSIDERFLTPIFTLSEGDRDGSPPKR